QYTSQHIKPFDKHRDKDGDALETGKKTGKTSPDSDAQSGGFEECSGKQNLRRGLPCRHLTT
ncbi:MAG: hypothetical protein Q7I95_05175, partial [Thiobacillus sp.]|nr:hypothetical protein [Thiobacillus sp.]